MPGATIPFTVSMTIPQDMISGTVHQVTIQAASQADPGRHRYANRYDNGSGRGARPEPGSG
jgi:hypothetical protein